MRKKILYLMHVDWDWIKQRPHYIAESLSENYEILVVYPYQLRRSQLTKNKKNKLKLRAILHVPYRNKLKISHILDSTATKVYMRIILKTFKPDYIWVTFPEIYKRIPLESRYKIIYDCMDDIEEFDDCNKTKFECINSEIELIKKSSIIFASSRNLIHVIDNRVPCRHKTVLIRNAFGGSKLNIGYEDKLKVKKSIYKICYVGTVSSWFDFELLYFCVKNIENIEFHIIGPVGVNIKVNVDNWLHERIIFHGSINHDEVYTNVKEFDCMIMPFVINKLVTSVDPVKLYEYVNYNKPIISIYYKEIERFSKYVSFYSTKEEVLDIINTMIKTGFIAKYDEKQREKLLNNNSWEIRANKIMKYLEKIDV